MKEVWILSQWTLHLASRQNKIIPKYEQNKRVPAVGKGTKYGFTGNDSFLL